MTDIAAAPLASAAPTPRGVPPIVTPSTEFARFYNIENFQFAHALKGHPLFTVGELAKLAQRMPDHRETYWSNGKVKVEDGWSTGPAERKSLIDTIENIHRNNSLVILKHTEQDAVYGPVLRQLLSEFVAYSGPRMREDVTIGEALILISSPKRLTAYHLDAETNFLVQVAGDKTFYVYDQTDPEIVTQPELEGYYAGNYSSAVFKPEDRARRYDLKAGYGLHIPPEAPHWVENGDDVSIALSINYELRSVERRAHVHRMNRILRRYGMTPGRPGQSPLFDGLKGGTAHTLAQVKGALKRKEPAPAQPTWSPSQTAEFGLI